MILTYHRVLPADRLRDFSLLEDLVTPQELFAKQMQFLAERLRPLPLAEMGQMVRENRALPGGAVSVTFDDGYADNYTNALPILQRYQVPATIFLVVNAFLDPRVEIE